MKTLFKVFLTLSICLFFLSSCKGNPGKGDSDLDSNSEYQISHENSIASEEAVIHEVDQAKLDSIRRDSINNASKCLTFQTFTSPKKMERSDVTLQLFSPLKTIKKNLASLGFELFDTKTFIRNDYYNYDGIEESYVEARLDNYKKLVKDQLTMVSIQSQDNLIIDISITFPQRSDLEAFKKTVKGNLKETKLYWWQLEVKYEGNKVIMRESEAS